MSATPSTNPAFLAPETTPTRTENVAANRGSHPSLRTRTAVLVAAVATVGAAVTVGAAPAQAATKRIMIYGSTYSSCQTQLASAARYYGQAGYRPSTTACVKNTLTAGGFNNYYGSITYQI